MSADIKPLHANSLDGGDIYRLLNLIHAMAGMLANEPKRAFTLARTNSDELYGPIITVWTNNIVDIEARTWRDQEPPYHEYSLTAAKKDSE